jgi:hypothetical protein
MNPAKTQLVNEMDSFTKPRTRLISADKATMPIIIKSSQLIDITFKLEKTKID